MSVLGQDVREGMAASLGGPNPEDKQPVDLAGFASCRVRVGWWVGTVP